MGAMAAPAAARAAVSLLHHRPCHFRAGALAGGAFHPLRDHHRPGRDRADRDELYPAIRHPARRHPDAQDDRRQHPRGNLPARRAGTGAGPQRRDRAPPHRPEIPVPPGRHGDRAPALRRGTARLVRRAPRRFHPAGHPLVRSDLLRDRPARRSGGQGTRHCGRRPPCHGQPPPAADDFPGPHSVTRLGQDDVDRLFGGQGFAAAVFAAPTGRWVGPLRSGFGWHLVRVTAAAPAHSRDFDAAHDDALRAWQEQDRADRDAAAYQQLLARYTVRRADQP